MWLFSIFEFQLAQRATVNPDRNLRTWSRQPSQFSPGHQMLLASGFTFNTTSQIAAACGWKVLLHTQQPVCPVESYIGVRTLENVTLSYCTGINFLGVLEDFFVSRWNRSFVLSYINPLVRKNEQIWVLTFSPRFFYFKSVVSPITIARLLHPEPVGNEYHPLRWSSQFVTKQLRSSCKRSFETLRTSPCPRRTCNPAWYLGILTVTRKAEIPRAKPPERIWLEKTSIISRLLDIFGNQTSTTYHGYDPTFRLGITTELLSG